MSTLIMIEREQFSFQPGTGYRTIICQATILQDEVDVVLKDVIGLLRCIKNWSSL